MESSVGHSARTLTPEETKNLQNDTKLVTTFKKTKFEAEACKNWDLFYKRNTVNFFKDRRWTLAEFKELSQITSDSNIKRVLLEVGCGVGNFLFPLIEEKVDFFIHACDFSKRAIDFVKSNKLYDSAVCNAFQCDLTVDSLTDTIAPNSVDVVSMIFVLSAIQPEKMVSVLKNIFEVLRPGGLVIFRDYGLYDQAMLRFGPGHKLEENFYVRQDGTMAYYFSVEHLEDIFKSAGFEVNESNYVQRRTVNKKEDIDVLRIFIQGKFIKPNFSAEVS